MSNIVSSIFPENNIKHYEYAYKWLCDCEALYHESLRRDIRNDEHFEERVYIKISEWFAAESLSNLSI